MRVKIFDTAVEYEKWVNGRAGDYTVNSVTIISVVVFSGTLVVTYKT